MPKPRVDSDIKLSDGRQLAYAEYGESDGVPVFLFHGLPGSRLAWGLMPGDPFPPHVRIIAPDRPGYGRSSPRARRTVVDWADDVIELADALKLKTFAVVGVSGGGPGALACAWKIPERLTAVGVVASAAPTNSPGVFQGMSKTNRFFMKLAWYVPWLSNANIRLLASFIRRDPKRYLNTMKFKVHDVDKSILARPEVLNMLQIDFAEALRNGASGMVADMSANHGKPWGFKLEDIKTKVHFWYCELDISVPPAIGKYFASVVPNNEITFVPDAGHLWSILHLREVLDALTDEL